jgi:hypothetical protein
LAIIDEMKEMVKVLANIINIVVERGVKEWLFNQKKYG